MARGKDVLWMRALVGEAPATKATVRRWAEIVTRDQLGK